MICAQSLEEARLIASTRKEEEVAYYWDDKDPTEEPGWYEGKNKDESLAEDLKAYRGDN